MMESFLSLISLVPPAAIGLLSGVLVLYALLGVFVRLQARRIQAQAEGVRTPGWRPWERLPTEDLTLPPPQRGRQVLVAGLPTLGTVRSARPTGERVGPDQSPVMDLVIEVEHPTRGSVQVELRDVVPRHAMTACQIGSPVTVRLDRNDPDYAVVDW